MGRDVTTRTGTGSLPELLACELTPKLELDMRCPLHLSAEWATKLLVGRVVVDEVVRD